MEGRWVGRPRIATLDLDIELEFTMSADDTVVGKLIGTPLGEINQPLRDVSIEDDRRRGRSVQGNVPVTFRRTSSR